MRVAWLTPYLPYPENTGGRIRIARLASGLRDRATLSLFACLSQHDSPHDAQKLLESGEWSEVHALPRVESPAALSSKPMAARRMPPELSRAIAAADRAAPFDAVVVEHCQAIEALPPLTRAAIVLDEHNVESSYYRGLLRTAPHRVLEYWSWRRYEKLAWQRADQVVTVTESDAKTVREHTPGKGVRIGNGTSVEAFRFVPPSQRTGSGILFVGMLDYAPNIKAARTLALDVLPLVRHVVPEATLTLCGRAPSAEVRSLASDSVRVTGTLPEVFSVFDRHAAYAMPLEQGAGSSLKVLEPLAAGLPLVASSFAVRGHELDPGCYIAAEGVADFARALIRVLQTRTSLDDIAARGRAAAERHSWKALAAAFAQVVEGTVGRS